MLRHHALRRDGTVRDTVMYSITRGEWPEIAAHLRYKLAQRRIAATDQHVLPLLHLALKVDLRAARVVDGPGELQALGVSGVGGAERAARHPPAGQHQHQHQHQGDNTGHQGIDSAAKTHLCLPPHMRRTFE